MPTLCQERNINIVCIRLIVLISPQNPGFFEAIRAIIGIGNPSGQFKSLCPCQRKTLKSPDFKVFLCCAPGERTFYRVTVPNAPGSGKR